MKLFEFFRKKINGQHIFLYCPRCNNELISSNSFVEDNDGIIKHRCTKCGDITFWDSHYPVPLLRTCADCKHSFFNSGGGVECEIEDKCNPSTQRNYEANET